MHCVTFFTKPDCTLCRSAWYVIQRVRIHIRFDLKSVDITAPGNEQWFDLYHEHIPVVHLDGLEIFRHRVDERILERHLA